MSEVQAVPAGLQVPEVQQASGVREVQAVRQASEIRVVPAVSSGHLSFLPLQVHPEPRQMVWMFLRPPQRNNLQQYDPQLLNVQILCISDAPDDPDSISERLHS